MLWFINAYLLCFYSLAVVHLCLRLAFDKFANFEQNPVERRRIWKLRLTTRRDPSLLFRKAISFETIRLLPVCLLVSNYILSQICFLTAYYSLNYFRREFWMANMSNTCVHPPKKNNLSHSCWKDRYINACCLIVENNNDSIFKKCAMNSSLILSLSRRLV